MADIDAMIRDADKRVERAVRSASEVARSSRSRIREFRWASAAASYTAPPLDGSRPGIFQMPLRPASMTKASLRTLVYHETIPGHHFQVAFGVENPQLPKFRQVRALGGISAISEGWALYAERMVAQEGWYEGDLEGLLGQLDDELFRARRLVVDTGLHAMRWTRQQAIDYGIEASEVERYVVNPGQACSYKIGQLEIFRLRDKARTALGQRFSIKEFHNVVLSAGSVPLTVLEREVDAYIAGKKAAVDRIVGEPDTTGRSPTSHPHSRLTAAGGSDVSRSHRRSLRRSPMGCASRSGDHRRPHTRTRHRRDDGDLLGRGRCPAAAAAVA